MSTYIDLARELAYDILRTLARGGNGYAKPFEVMHDQACAVLEIANDLELMNERCSSLRERVLQMAAMSDIEALAAYVRVGCSTHGEYIKLEISSMDGLGTYRCPICEASARQTCATCRLFREEPSICTKEPQEWPMHWRETWPSFGCNGHEPAER